MSSTEIVRYQSFEDVESIAKTFALTGYFDAKGTNPVEIAKAITQIMAGAEMGFGPFASIQGIHIINGRPSVSGGLIAKAIKKSAKYDYRIREKSDTICRIEFFELIGGKWESLGVETFTAQDAKRAGTKNMDKFPANMLFNRAIANGYRAYCPDVFEAGSVYVPEEMEGGDFVESTARTVDTATGEIVEQPQAISLRDNEPGDLTHTAAFKKMHALGREAMGENWRNGEGREFLKSITGKESTKELTAQEIANVIDALETLKRGAPPEPQDVLFDQPAKVYN